MTIVVEESTIALDRATIIKAFQIDDFCKTGHPSHCLLKPPAEPYIQYITTHLPRPVQAPSRSTSRDRRARSRSADVISWPTEWAVDKSSFRVALKRFEAATRQLAELLRPPSIGNTPPRSPLQAPITSIMGDRGANASGSNQPAVDPALLATIQQIVQTSMQGMMQGMRPAANPDAGMPDPPRSGKLRAEDLGYFDPDYESENNESIVSVGRHIYYRDMFVWIDHLKDLVKNHSEEEVRPMITQALRGGALI